MLRAESFFVDSTVEKLVIDNRNNMKLYPLIYLNEAAPTATEAIGKDVAAITSDDYADWEMESPTDHSIVLISTNRAMSIMKSCRKKVGHQRK